MLASQNAARLNGGVFHTKALIDDPVEAIYQEGYDDGFAECRKEAWFTMIMIAAFSGVSGILAGMAIADFIL